MIIVGIVAFLVLGPDRLPDFFAQIARFVGQLRAWVFDLKHQFDEETKQVTQPVEYIKQEVNASVKEVKSDLSRRVENS